MDYFKNSKFKKDYSLKLKIIYSAVLFYGVCFFTAPMPNLAQQTASNQTSANASPTITASPAGSPTPIPFSDVISQAESASATLKEIAAGIASSPAAESVERELPVLTDEINTQLKETAQVVAGANSLDKLRGFESNWRNLTKNLPDWRNDLTARARQLEDNLRRLEDLSGKWQNTLEELRKTETPPEVLARVEEIISTSADTRRRLEAEQARVVTLQNRVSDQQKRVDEAINSIRKTREALVGQLLVQDSPPIWSDDLWNQAGIRRGISDSIVIQLAALNAFVARSAAKLILHLSIFVVLAAGLVYLSRRASPATKTEPELTQAAVIFFLPISTALVLAILVSSWIYPQTPQMLSAIFGAIVLLPTVIILKRLIERSLYPLLYSLVVFYFIDQLRVIADAVPTVSRPLFLAEMLGGFLFFLWLYKATARKPETEDEKRGRIFRFVRAAALLMLPFFAVALLANVLGYVNLALLVGDAVLRTAYTGVVLYAVVRIIDGLIVFALRFRPLNLLQMVRNFGPTIQKKAQRFVRFVAGALWILAALEFFTLRETVFRELRVVLTAELNLGSLSISAADVLLFFAVVWAAFILSRFVRFVLEEDIYPRFSLAHGIPYAISTILNYVILLIGFFFAVGAAGLDLTRITVLVGAFGVGIGFGLQNIFNNFMSGLILLFERPVKIGDEIMIGDASGTVRRIGIRASVIRQWDNSEIIVPNSKLISENVKNWTRSTRKRGVEIPVSVTHGTDVTFISDQLVKIAAAHPLVADKPEPQVLVSDFGTAALNLKLRAWVTDSDKTSQIKSDLAKAVSQTLAENNIVVPDVHSNTVI